MSNNLKSDKRGSFYWYQGKPYASVTNILKVIDKPALRYWFGREVYWAFVNQPNLTEQEALAAPYRTSDRAKARGTTVHSIVEAFKKTGGVLTEVAPEFKGYATGFNRWVSEYNANIIENEKSVFNHDYQYAGTLDMLAHVGDHHCIIDIKTGKDIYGEAGLQLSAYKHTEGTEVDSIGVLLLQPEGTYKFQWMKDEFDAFLAAKKLWEWANGDMLSKIKYFR